VVEKDGTFRLDPAGAPVDYAFSSDSRIITPLILQGLRGHSGKK